MTTMLFISICFIYAEIIILNLIEIANLSINQMFVLSPAEFLRIKLHVSLLTALLISHPLWYNGIYRFAEPGLTSREKKVMIVSFLVGTVLFLVGAIIGLLYLSPFLIDLLLEQESNASARLSVNFSVRLLISVSVFSGILFTLPILILMLSNHIPNKSSLKKYIYILIFIVVSLATPDPAMIVNLIFLIFFALVMEITILFSGVKNEN